MKTLLLQSSALERSTEGWMVSAAIGISKHRLTFSPTVVLINNAGILRAPGGGLADIRAAYNEILNTNLTSIAVMTIAFKPLLHKSTDPKVINITSGLASMQNALTKKMGRFPSYGTSKVGLNGLTVHMQIEENDRIEAEKETLSGRPRIRFYVAAPGLLKTAFTGFWEMGKDPALGAEVVYHLATDDKHTYEGASQWEFEEGEMRRVPW